MSLILNIDSDGVLFPFHTEMARFIRRAGLEPNMTTWNLGLDRATFVELFDAAISMGVFQRGVPIKGSIQGIKALRDAGHRVRIVTSKIMEGKSRLSQWAMSDTLHWYNLQGLGDLEFVFTGSVHGKTGYPADVVIDDHPSLEWVQDDAFNILFAQPWNAGALTSHGPLPYVAHGWDQVLKLIEWHTEQADRSPVVI